MNEFVVSWLATALVGLGVLLLLILAGTLLARRVRMLATKMYCPWVGRAVEVRTLALDGQDPVCVVSCTAFANPRVVTCGMPCIGGDHRADLVPGDRSVATLVDG
jgi:hypothetical protein